MEKRKLNFDVSRGGIQHRLLVRVGDARSRTVTARFYSGSAAIPVTAAYLRALRKDGLQLYNACTVADNAVTYTFTSEDLGEAGELVCEFDLHHGESVMTSPRFIVLCEDLLYSGEGVESSEAYAAYVAALLKLENLTADAVSGEEMAVETEVTESAIRLHFTIPQVNTGDGGTFVLKTDETLSQDGGVLRVCTASEVEADNTLPVTSAAVAATVGNIEILLKTI